MVQPGTPKAVQQLVDDHYAALFRYAYRLSGSGGEAEDLTQEAFCKAQQHLGQLRDPDRARPWLFRILRNAYLHRARSRHQQPCVPLEGVGDLPERPADPPTDIDPERLQRALDELPDGFRTPILLYYFEELSYRDIAELMGLPLGTVMSRLARAKAHLRCRLTDSAADLGTGVPVRQSRGGQ
jgi:RNA polymerase sigma-70 factor (ECF subfamily)